MRKRERGENIRRSTRGIDEHLLAPGISRGVEGGTTAPARPHAYRNFRVVALSQSCCWKQRSKKRSLLSPSRFHEHRTQLDFFRFSIFSPFSPFLFSFFFNFICRFLLVSFFFFLSFFNLFYVRVSMGRQYANS